MTISKVTFHHSPASTLHNTNIGSSSWRAPYTFSGKEKDAETGYGYFGARYYDSGLSIWLSVDPMSDKYPSMSPYNYCGNNPVILVDPDGRDLDVGGIINNSTYDLMSIVNSENSHRINEVNGHVSVNVDGMTEEQIKADVGLSLIYGMVHSDKKFLYESTDYVDIRNSEGNPIIDCTQASRSGVINASNGGKDSKDGHTHRPREGYAGQVIISQTAQYSFSGIGDGRNSLVYHELMENFLRTDIGLNYKDSNGSRGAHNEAAFREGNRYGNPEPGSISVTHSPPSTEIRNAIINSLIR